MAFDNVTFFEVNLPNEVFDSGRTAETDVDALDVGDRGGDDQSGGGSKGKLFLAALVLAGVALGVRRFRSGGDEEEDIEMAYEEPGVQVEQSEP